MLTIENIKDLKGSGFHWESKDWQFADAFGDVGREWMKESHYTITFNRGPYGGAILISREPSNDPYYYRVRICYENYPNVIYDGRFHIRDIRDRKGLWEWGVRIMDAERVKLR